MGKRSPYTLSESLYPLLDGVGAVLNVAALWDAYTWSDWLGTGSRPFHPVTEHI
jgi:hypothetical protein